jgi:hypothetical protein
MLFYFLITVISAFLGRPAAGGLDAFDDGSYNRAAGCLQYLVPVR